MKSERLVAVYGHLFPNFEIEMEVLARAGISLVDANPVSDAELALLGAHGFLLGPFKKLDRERLARLSGCRGVVRYGIGVDNVDVAAAKERGIVVCNVPDYCVEEVAMHVLACSLALTLADPELRRGVIEHVPLHRFGTPEEMAGAVRYLVSSAAAYTTGQTLVIDGGLTACGARGIGPK